MLTRKLVSLLLILALLLPGNLGMTYGYSIQAVAGMDEDLMMEYEMYFKDRDRDMVKDLYRMAPSLDIKGKIIGYERIEIGTATFSHNESQFLIHIVPNKDSNGVDVVSILGVNAFVGNTPVPVDVTTLKTTAKFPFKTDFATPQSDVLVTVDLFSDLGLIWMPEDEDKLLQNVAVYCRVKWTDGKKSFTGDAWVGDEGDLSLITTSSPALGSQFTYEIKKLVMSKNVSGNNGDDDDEDEMEISKAKLEMLPVYVPAHRANGDPVDLIYRDAFGNVTSTRSEAKPLVAVYSEEVPGQFIPALDENGNVTSNTVRAKDVFAAVSMDEGNTWKRVNLSRSADRFSFEFEDGTVFLGDTHKPNIKVQGNKILVAWTSKYAKSGTPTYAIEEGEPGYVEDIWGVGGPQRSRDYADDGYPGYIVPYSVVWVTRGFVDEATGEVTWMKAERLTSGRRDANQITIASSNFGFGMVWQEDPEGLRPGEAAGPGEGWSGATTNQKTDIWYTFIGINDFELIDTNYVPNGDPQFDDDDDEDLINFDEINGDVTQTKGTGRPKALVQMSLPIRLSDNDILNTDSMKIDERKLVQESDGSKFWRLAPEDLPPYEVEAPIVDPSLEMTVLTEEPLLEEAVIEEPAVNEPAAEEPATDETLVEEPVAEEPAVEEPAVEEPVVEEPVVEEPAAEEPAVEDPAAEEPVAEEPAVEEPAAEEPAVEEPAAVEPAVVEPTVEEPTVEEPVVEEPFIESTETQEPVLEELTTGTMIPEEPQLPDPLIATEVLLEEDADNGDHDGSHAYGYELEGLLWDSVKQPYLRFYETVNNQGVTKFIAITVDGRLMDGDTGASRPNLMMQGQWAVLGYEETKGAGGGSPHDDEEHEVSSGDGSDDYDPDLGKNVIYHSFSYSKVDQVSSGKILNPQATDADGNLLWLVDEEGNEILDYLGKPIPAYENARRPRFLIQSKDKIGESRTVMVALYKMGEEGKGRPSDIMMQRWVVNSTDTGNPYRIQNMSGKVQNISSVTPLETMPTSNEEQIKMLRWEQTVDNLDDRTSAYDNDDARAHRGFIRGDFIAVAYTWTPNWTASRNGNDKYDLYVRRSFNGGQKWSTDPNGNGVTHTDIFRDAEGGFYPFTTTIENGEFEPARNVSLLRNNKQSVIEPRLVGVPGSILTDGAPKYAEDIQDPNSFWITFGTELNVDTNLGDDYDEDEIAATPLDLYYSYSKNLGETLYTEMKTINEDSDGYNAGEVVEVWDWLAKDTGDYEPAQAEAQIRMTPDASIFYAIWNESGIDPETGHRKSNAVFRRIMRNYGFVEVKNRVAQ